MNRAGREPWKAAVARVLDARGQVVGAGLRVPSGEVVTCAHVVDRALNRRLETNLAPTGRVQLDFPLAEQQMPSEATVIHWRPEYDGRPMDLAVLRPCRPSSPTVAEVLLVDCVGNDDRVVHTCGFPKGKGEGVWSVGRLRGEQGDGWVQFDSDSSSPNRVEAGFSGAPVWDRQAGGVVGLIVQADMSPDVPTAYLVPTQTLPCWSSSSVAT